MLTYGDSAAGLLLRDRGRVLMQLRARGIQHGGTWSIPGGALMRGESATDAALRETREETGLRRRDLRLTDFRHVAKAEARWTYTTVLARLRKRARGKTLLTTWESERHEWVAVDDVASLNLHPGFAASWPKVRGLLRKPTRVLFVCVGNICRSPLAAVVMRCLADDASVPVHADSTGIWAEVGRGMHPGTAECAARHGLDGSAHIARQLRHADIAAHDVVVSLDPQADAVVRRIASRLDKPPLLLNRPTLNPWNANDDGHEEAYRQVEAVCAEVLATITR